MKDVNKMILVGRLGADPVRRETKKGIAVVNFPIATTRRVRTESGDGGESVFEEETQWHNVVAWGRNGENCAQYIGKGDTVYVEGEVRSRKYEDREGVNRSAFEVHADEVIFLSTLRRNRQAGLSLITDEATSTEVRTPDSVQV